MYTALPKRYHPHPLAPPPPPSPPSSCRPSPRSGSPFGPAATRPGLHIWRVEKLRPVEVPKATWGTFFSGDAYLVLHNGPDERAHLHLWMGEPPGREGGGTGGLGELGAQRWLPPQAGTPRRTSRVPAPSSPPS